MEENTLQPSAEEIKKPHDKKTKELKEKNTKTRKNISDLNEDKKSSKESPIVYDSDSNIPGISLKVRGTIAGSKRGPYKKKNKDTGYNSAVKGGGIKHGFDDESSFGEIENNTYKISILISIQL